MDRLETELREALRRKPAPAGFGARLSARLARERTAPSARAPRWSRWPIWAAAATLLLGFGLGLAEHGRRIRERNRAALEETLTALSIAAEQLERAESQAFSRWERLGDGLSRAPSSDQPRLPPELVHSNDTPARR
jgi:hypothetical protein